MAIINCPECNGTISDTVTHCVHCGYKINLCPECKSFLKEGSEICSECGYAIHSADQDDKIAAKNKEDYSDKGLHIIYKEWKKSTSLPLIYKLLRIVFCIIAGVIILIACNKFNDWCLLIKGTAGAENIYGSLDAALLYGSTINTIIFLAVIVGVLGLCASLLDRSLTKSIKQNFNKWYTDNNIDINRALELSLSDISRLTKQELKRRKEELKTPLEYVFLDASEEVRKEEIKLRNIDEITSSIMGVALEIIFIFCTKNYMTALLQQGAAASFNSWPIIICFAVFFIVGAIFGNKTLKFLEAQQDNYIKENLPDSYSLYRRYMMEDTTYFPEEK